MRSLKMILAGLFAAIAIAAAVAAGFVAAAVIGAIGFTVYVVRRLLGRPPASPARPNAGRPGQAPGAADAIEVTATEVRSEPNEPKLTH